MRNNATRPQTAFTGMFPTNVPLSVSENALYLTPLRDLSESWPAPREGTALRQKFAKDRKDFCSESFKE